VSVSQSSDDTGIDVGAGFVINRVFTLLTGVSIPAGVGRPQPSFGLSVVFNFGRSSKR